MNSQISPRESKTLVAHFAAKGLISRKDNRGSNCVVKVDAQKICRAVCEAFELTVFDLMSPDRPDYIAHPRQVAMYLMREIWGWGHWSIGNYFMRDHGTVVWACQRVRDRMDTYPAVRNKIKAIQTALRIEGDGK